MSFFTNFYVNIFQGRVNLLNPDHRFCLMDNDDYGANNGLPSVVQRRIFFGREVGAADRKILQTYQLKSRKYLGPTAMDAEMAFLMANQAQVKPGKLVYDPFVGTGSILIAASHFGAMTMVRIFICGGIHYLAYSSYCCYSLNRHSFLPHFYWCEQFRVQILTSG